MLKHSFIYILLFQCLALSQKPNVLCIVIDDLRDELACYGFSHMHTPHIDQLAKSGTLFTRAYCQKALCGPSRSSFFTGMRPSTLGVYSNKMHFREKHPQLVSMAQHFKNHGYHSSAFGKILHNTQSDNISWSQDQYYPKTHLYAAPGRKDMQVIIGKVEGNENHPLFEAPDVDDTDYRDGLITQRALDHMSHCDKSKPQFMMVGYHKPHTPFNAPKKYWDLYQRDQIPLATNSFYPEGTPEKIIPKGNYVKGFEDIPDHDFPDELAREIKHAYYACVSYIDAQVGLLLEGLKQHKLDKNTIVVLWSDHGYQLGEHTAWCKHSNFEQALKVPLIMSIPGYKQPKRCHGISELIDIFPSLSELCGLPIPQHLDGKSLLPLLKSPDYISHYSLSEYSRAGLKGWSLRLERYRYTEWRNKKGFTEIVELYDHKQDPKENMNLAAHPEMKEIIEQLRKKLNQVL